MEYLAINQKSHQDQNIVIPSGQKHISPALVIMFSGCNVYYLSFYLHAAYFANYL